MASTMKRLSLLLVAAGLLVGCGPSRMPSDFNANAGGGNSTGLDTRPPGFSAMADAIRNNNIPPEAILTATRWTPRNAPSWTASPDA
jgi:hypothetical protein